MTSLCAFNHPDIERCSLDEDTCRDVSIGLALLQIADPTSHARVVKAIEALEPTTDPAVYALCLHHAATTTATLFFNQDALRELAPTDITRVVFHEAGHVLDVLDHRTGPTTSKARRERLAEIWVSKWTDSK